jgi:hypothetical protein
VIKVEFRRMRFQSLRAWVNFDALEIDLL